MPYDLANRWLEEEWGFGADGRVFGVPLLSLVDVPLAVAELERLLARGARMVHLLAGPVLDAAGAGRSPGDPYFDPSGRASASRGGIRNTCRPARPPPPSAA